MIRTEPRPHHNETETSFNSMISTFLAGKLSEEMFLNSKTTSCIYDLSSARKIATDMVTKFGMGKTSGITALNPEEYPAISESMKENICKDIQKILTDAAAQAKEILENHRLEIKKIAEKLLLCGTLNQTEINNLFTEANQ
jgi:cell division protease FtsH